METQTLVNEICPTTTLSKVKKGALLVDVREVNEVNELAFNVSNLINIPLSEFENRYAEIPKNIDVILVCNSGNRSLRAAGFLVNHGFNNVFNMKNGIAKWVQKGFSTSGNTEAYLTTETVACCCGSADKKNIKTCC